MTEDPSGAKLCPICRKPAVETFWPFCSRRCADVDLNRWFSGVYAVRARRRRRGRRAEKRTVARMGMVAKD